MVGLDIRPQGIWLMQLKRYGKKFQALQMVALELPENVFMDGKIRQFEMIERLLKEHVIKMKLRGLATAIHIPVNLIREQTIQIPSELSPVAIQQEIKMQLEKDFPGLNDALAMDFIVEKAELAGYANIHFVVTREEYISQYVSCINSTGLTVKIVDVDTYALKRLVIPHPFSSISFSSHLLEQNAAENMEKYLLACSLAMREVPKW